ncbi:glycosyltransferase [Salegentibacter sp. Hel_I_6]|uniref:glycosyltransferase n=1 Tax=Salegentibacter sp. Hel_I_6 TaxID=1250278 RepID=UPI00055CCB4D|nr:glycosyltransferase [Salegentibacter sp. Hel_I_6]
MTGQTILVTGVDIDPQYNRTLILLNGLKKLGFDVEVFNFSEFTPANADEIKRLSEKAYFTYVPSFGHKAVSFVKKNSACDVVFDPLISKYMTNVKDYNLYGKISYEALRSKYRDQRSISKADFIIFDTRSHRDYFLEKYRLKKNKTGILYVGANTLDFSNSASHSVKSDTFRVGFLGHFIPLQGVLKILEAAKLLKQKTNIEFTLIGEGFEFKKAVDFANDHKLTNVKFEGKLPYTALDAHINSFDLCLGIFGDTFKSKVVIPNKIFNYASCSKPVLTLDSDAIREIFTHREDIYLCSGDAESISEAILKLKEDLDLREKIGENIGKLVSDNFNEVKTASTLVNLYQNFKEENSV